MNIDHKTKAEIVTEIADLIARKYVFPEMGQQIVDELQRVVATDAPFLTLHPTEFASTLTQDYLAMAQDTHLRLDYVPEQTAVNGEELMKHHFKQAQRNNFGFIKVERLAGNIGYLRILEFAPPAREIAVGAMAFVANTQALIFDIRGHRGGSPDLVQLLISYLVPNTSQPLSGVYSRATGQTTMVQTLSEIPGKRMPNVPVYVLVDGQTHSAAEAFAYDLQALKRATIIGERTRGGAHLVDFVLVHRVFKLMVPIARAINPITNGNWQGHGVVPDVDAVPEDALRLAHQQALYQLLKSTSDTDERALLQAEMETV